MSPCVGLSGHRVVRAQLLLPVSKELEQFLMHAFYFILFFPALTRICWIRFVHFCFHSCTKTW